MKYTNSLFTNLIHYSQENYYPFHMPGHKRTALDFPNPWSIDITEIDGFDNLHHAQGILKELQQDAAALFGVKKSFCLVNGSTCGLLTAISACVKPQGKLLMSRNCHKSVYHGVYLRNITPVYVMPEMTDFGIMGSLSPEKIKKTLAEQPDIQAVLVVSPTYDGVVSDIREIAKIVHAHGIPLIVDEAHGAHFPLSDDFPASAITCGADIVVQSLHKTLPAFTQTALLHLCSDLVDENTVQRFSGIYQSSSPSYLLLASIDQCMQHVRKYGTELFSALRENLTSFYKKCQNLKYIQVFSGQAKGEFTYAQMSREQETGTPAIFDRDDSRILISAETPGFSGQETGTPAIFDRDDSKILISAEKLGLSGQALSDILLKNYHIQLEMASGHYALALASLMDTKEGFQRLFDALFALDTTAALRKEAKTADIINSRELYHIPKQKMTIAKALEMPQNTVPLTEAAGAVSKEYIYLYPPGIPLIAPGEVIDTDLLKNIQKIKEGGLHLEGLSDMTNTRIKIVNF